MRDSEPSVNANSTLALSPSVSPYLLVAPENRTTCVKRHFNERAQLKLEPGTSITSLSSLNLVWLS